MKINKTIIITLLCIIVFTSLVRFRLADVPFERDEGEYAYAGQLILKGIPPYQQFYNMKLPGIYAVYACLLAVFGQTHTGVHTGLLVINALTILLIFFLVRRVIDNTAGVVAAACFALLSVGQAVQGIFANAEHFVMLPVMGGLILLLKGQDEDRQWLLFLSGLLFGTGFIIKQHGVLFIAFGGLYILINGLHSGLATWPRQLSRCMLFTMGAVVPYVATCLIMFQAGVFEKFWFWTVDYAKAYSSQISFKYAWQVFSKQSMNIGASAPLIWLLSGLGLISLVLDKRLHKRAMFVFMFVLFSFLAICPGFYFRPHYFVLILPAASMLAGITISSLWYMLSNVRVPIVKYGVPILVAFICLGLSVNKQKQFLFEMTPVEACRATYGLNPFPESIEISQYIKENTDKNDRVAVIGSEPQIYFYSDRRSATGYIYMYPLMENHEFALQMQKEMIQEVESAKPEVLVFVWVPTSWLRRVDSHDLLFKWFETYQAAYYSLTGLVNIFNNTSVYQWGQKVKWPPESDYWIAILKRKHVDLKTR
jgi:hypothetical protein